MKAITNIRLLRDTQIEGRSLSEGEKVKVDERLAAVLIKRGDAQRATAPYPPVISSRTAKPTLWGSYETR